MRYIFPVVRAIITLVLLLLVFRETGFVTALSLLALYLLLDYRTFRIREALDHIVASMVMVGKEIYGRNAWDEAEREAKRRANLDEWRRIAKMLRDLEYIKVPVRRLRRVK